MKSNARLIKVASAVICSCAIATTAFAVPSSVNDLVEKVYLPYTKYKNPFEDINKYEAEIRKIGCRIDEGRNSWVLYQSENNKPCMDMPGVTHVAIRYSTEVPSLMVIAESGAAKFNEIERYEKLTSVKDAETQTTTYIYQNGDIRYDWVKDYKGFSVLTMRMDKSPAVSQATPQKAKDSTPNTQAKVTTAKVTPPPRNTQPIRVSSSDDSGGIGWLAYLAGALVLGLIALFFLRSQKIATVTKIAGKEWVEENVHGFFGIFSVADLVEERYKMMTDFFSQGTVDSAIQRYGFDNIVKALFLVEIQKKWRDEDSMKVESWNAENGQSFDDSQVQVIGLEKWFGKGGTCFETSSENNEKIRFGIWALKLIKKGKAFSINFPTICKLLSKYNSEDIAIKILNCEIWEGATKEQMKDSWGNPTYIDNRPGPRVTWEGWYYGANTEKEAYGVIWFRTSSNKGEEGAKKWTLKN